MLSFWAVTIFDTVWVIKNQILDGFLFNSVLAWPQMASVRSQGELQDASHISGTITSILPSGHKSLQLFFLPRVLRLLTTGAGSEEPKAKQQMETVIRHAEQVICHLALHAVGARAKKQLHICQGWI